ncbi:hypothetical protein Pmar_PMAR001060 [Perkinsus marinus ATCC 50983]|uniref:J domain-containing protein n=1 Tax=Perkinsus marinus (strain ATCC 50983 / TXsc) TaxID=423536 RepID=C5KTF8_PERM5|nr:hypothetical protein Pmar_PMAR001060 [Perkinsus marinus ATCC 50983]EER12263.1 hypothetical protein Pmar_PMAR001060 [Perkinsus marinus ATCC 50983]|eukprot:XP_002780468.1 hypothetical protein Pmar_PMAR001060 [Perkinsus marinus ATCC 50983]
MSSPRKRRKSGHGPERRPSPSPGPPRGSTGGSIARMTIKMLKEELTREGIDFSKCVEKSELVDKLRRARQGRTHPSARGSAAPAGSQELRPPRRSLRLSQAAALQPKAVLKSPLMVELERIEGLPSSAKAMQVLGLTKQPCTVGEVKKKLRALSKVLHPDKTANEPHLRGRASAAFQRINSAAQEAIKLLEEATTAPPGRVQQLTYHMEGEVLIVQWRPPTDVTSGTTPIEQGVVNAQGSTTDEGWVECAISSQGRKGNDILFRRQQFHVSGTTESETIPTGGSKRTILYYVIVTALIAMFAMLSALLVLVVSPEVSAFISLHAGSLSSKLASLLTSFKMAVDEL